MSLDKYRFDFKILNQRNPIIYLDNASTTFKPTCVLNKIQEYYSEYPVNTHRAIYSLSQKASMECDSIREKVRGFIGAKKSREIIFTKGCTEAINLVASSFGSKYIKEGDEIIISQMEHHANIVPWRMLCDKVGAKLKIIPINKKGELEIDVFKKMLSEKVKIISIVYISNTLGTINPIKEIIEYAHAFDIKVLVDAAQAIAHIPIDVTELDIDFLCFSGHKLYGPTGVGVLYGKESLLEIMPPYQGGGNMIDLVSFDKISYSELPGKFEAGTIPISSVLALGAAIQWVENIGFDAIISHENILLNYALEEFKKIDGINIIGDPGKRSSIFSFVVDNCHPHDISTILNQKNIAIRAGHHCTQPIMKFYSISATSRVSFAVYNTKEEINFCINALIEVKDLIA